ncbi:MAG TPA: bifunctional tetrahydrofolate synthase/dihydrofolate synthase [Steroidobacteraceae bacterium]|nr:bifunctional tetrahydrofolate synthase/dihydrofolate synthase [Steroidobacteraceae bacterium]
MSRTLADWLSYQEKLHPSTIDLGLERLARVLARLQWSTFKYPVITVGGTNGKGSCVALLESILSSAGYRVGAFTSPHLIRYNERIRLAGREVFDAELITAFERIEHARGEISLTFFEFNALAAMLIFAEQALDVVVLEVGLGGRLDAVNIIDADVAVVSSIALDHCEWLGNDVESIAREKAGIFRAQRPAIFGARAMPTTIAVEAKRVGANLQRLGEHFDFTVDGAVWNWHSSRRDEKSLPHPALPGAVQFENASAVLAALDALRSRLLVDRSAIESGLLAVKLSGRFQMVRHHCEWLLDVAHNPAAATTLAKSLSEKPCAGRTIAVCGVLADKDVDGVIAAVGNEIDAWVVAGIDAARALASRQLADAVAHRGGAVVHIAADVAAACAFARSFATTRDRIVVFGSFYTVGPALQWLQESDG